MLLSWACISHTNYHLRNDSSGIGAALAGEMLVASKDPIGIRLLRRMGWREGQGVGPRVKRKREELEDGDIYAEDQLFAPRDVTAIILQGHHGVLGLGYNPYENAPELANRNTAKQREEDSVVGIKGESVHIYMSTIVANLMCSGNIGGFGTGILDDDDDDEFYSSTFKPSSKYDMVIDDDEDSFVGPKSQTRRELSSAKKPLESVNVRLTAATTSVCTNAKN
jgi:G patch domain-containing protein 1